MNTDKITRQVEEYWNNNPCGSDSSLELNRKLYFEEIERKRYKDIEHIPVVAKFEDFNRKKVLEIGCGLGTDGRQFAKNGAIYTGINIDSGSVCLAQEAFSLYNLNAEILQMNAEKLEFTSDFFDHIYSCGVIHHSPNTERIVQEMFRVLKKKGTVKVMVYNKESINYYLQIMFIRKIFRVALLPKFMPGFISMLTGLNEQKLKRHREIFLKEKMTKEKWISINTDGPDNPFSKVYAKKEIIKIFSDAGFSNIKTYVRYFDRKLWPFINVFITDKFAEWLGNKWGWCIWVEGVKK